MIRKIIINLLIALVAMILAACTPQSAALDTPTFSPVTPEPATKAPADSATPTDTAGLETIPPAPTPFLSLSVEEQTLFTIPNTEPWSGKEGDPRPDWKGWGAAAFGVAPDGTFWIADTAVFPNRLLHYSPEGKLLRKISLEDRVVYAYDLAISGENLWILDITSQPPKVIKFSLEGDYLSSVIAQSQVYSLTVGEENELLLSGSGEYIELIDSSGEVTGSSVESLAYYGHTYQIGAYNAETGKIPVFVDGGPFEPDPEFFLEADPFLGFNPDGSFALAGYEMVDEAQLDRQVRFYNPAGELLGIARQHPQTMYKDFNHHLAMGPTGAVYQLLSNPDHSVQVARLGFSKELPPFTPNPVVTPTPLTTLALSESPETEEEEAGNALISFFANLSAGNYAAAADQFGGDMSEYAREPMQGESEQAYWEYVCEFLWCLPIAEITDVEQVSAEEYLFHAIFVMPDGRRFEIGACCGADPAANPPVWQFAYPVQKIDGIWKVMRGPLFTP